MPSKIEKWIFNLSLPVLFLVIVISLFTQPSFTGFITSDGSYKSPTSDGSYKSPTSDNSYESPTTGPGYIAPKIDESWEAPKEGPGFLRPEVGPGFLKPEIGPGFERPKIGEGYERIGTYNVSFNESGEKIIKRIIELPKVNLTDKKKEDIIKNDPKKKKIEPKGPIDASSVGGWKVYGITHYYKKGGSKFIPATIAQMNLHDDGTYDYRGHEGAWDVSDITEDDWKKWGIKNENFKQKLTFHNWPDGVDGTADGPIEDTSYGARYLWAVFNAESPESAEPAQVWVRFVAAPYVPKVQKEEDESFSELSLIGRWGIHFTTKVDTTTILELKADKTWAFGSSSGTWKVLPIEKKDWTHWGVEPYGPRKKIVLDKFGEDGGFGPIEVYKGEVSFFWLRYDAKNTETGEVLLFMKKFRPWESDVTYLTGEIKGSGGISTDDGKLSCTAKEQQAAKARRGHFFMRRAWSADATEEGTPEIETTEEAQEREPAQARRGQFFTRYAWSADTKGCTAEYEVGKEAEMTAIPENGWLFLKWSGGCEGAETTCKVTMDKSKTVKAEFVLGCTEDSACSSDQKCENSKCVPVECECGYAVNHQCQKYECCKKADCGEEKACDTTTHKCVSESECREFSIKGDPAEKHDVVFVGDGFDDYKLFRQLLVFLVDYEGKYNGMLSVSPFKENKDKFNFWMVLAPDYQYRDDGEPVNEDIERFVKTCERDTVVVISRNTYRAYAFFPTSGSKGGRAYVSLGFAALRGTDFAAEQSGRLLLHEFGHAFGGLTDEYVEYGKGTRNDLHLAPNCAETLEKAKAKWGDLVGVGDVDFYTGVPDVPGTKYYKNPYVSIPEVGLFPDGSDVGDGGCSYDLKNIRPTKGSIMKLQIELDYDFEPVNERELTKKLEEYSSEPVKQDTSDVPLQKARTRKFAADAG